MYYNIYITQEAKSYEKAIKRNIRFVREEKMIHDFNTSRKFEVSERTIVMILKISMTTKEQEINDVLEVTVNVMEEDISRKKKKFL